MIFENQYYKVGFNEKTGAIESLFAFGKEFVKKPIALFGFRIWKDDTAFDFTSDEARSIKCTLKDGYFCASFSQFSKLTLNFEVRAELCDCIRFYISFCKSDDFVIEYINYPLVCVPNDLLANGGSGRILLDMNEGLLCEDVSMREKTFGYLEPEYPSRGLCGIFPAVVESQFIAYYDDDGGIYIGAEDETNSIKGIDFLPSGDDGIKLQMRIYPGVSKDVKSHDGIYPTVIRFFKGSWEDAAEIYRKWFEAHIPDGLLPIKDADDLPEWYTDSPLVVTYPVCGVHDTDIPTPNKLFPYENALPYIDEISSETGCRIMTLLMHWEGTAPWAPPYVWPPVGGEKMLFDFCRSLHERGHLLGVYCSGTGFTLKSNLNSYNTEEKFKNEKLETEMCVSFSQDLLKSRICTGQRDGYDMCVSRNFTKRTLCTEARHMASVGLDYIQILDQNHGGTPYFCYSDRHGHPNVPGKWLVSEMKEMLSQIKETVGDGILLGCESAAAETYIPYLRFSDNRFNLNMHCGRPVPLYSYLYHEYVNNFSGNSVCSNYFIDVNKSPESYLFRIAYSFVAGDLPTLVINDDGNIVWNWGEKDFSHLPQRGPILRFISEMTKFRKNAGKKFLVYGKMKKAYKVESEKIGMYKVEFPDYKTDYPTVLSSLFESDDGEYAQFLANYLTEKNICTIDLSKTNGALIVDENGNEKARLQPKKQELTLDPVSVTMLKIL